MSFDAKVRHCMDTLEQKKSVNKTFKHDFVFFFKFGVRMVMCIDNLNKFPVLKCMLHRKVRVQVLLWSVLLILLV